MKSTDKTRRKVLIIAYAFPPHSVVGSLRPLRFCKYLSQCSSWDPVVLTVKKDFQRKDSELLKELSNNVPVYRAPIFEPVLWYESLRSMPSSCKTTFNRCSDPQPSGKSSFRALFNPKTYFKKFVRFVYELFSTPDPQILWVFPVIFKAITIILKHKIDAILITSPPWSVQTSGYVLKKIFRIPWIVDLRDPWTDIDRVDRLIATRKMDAYLEKKCLASADFVFSTSDTYSQQLEIKYPSQNSDKFITLYNGFDEDKFNYVSYAQSDIFTIAHLGTLYSKFDSFFIFEALGSWLKECHPSAFSKVRLIFIGEIASDLKQVLIENNLLEITEITGFKPHKEAIKIASSADALLLSIGLSPFTPKGWLPSKLFEYIALNRPIVASVIEGEAADLIRRSRSGFVIGSKDKNIYFKIFNELYQKKMSRDDKKLLWDNNSEVVEKFKQRHLILKLSQHLDRIALKSDS